MKKLHALLLSLCVMQSAYAAQIEPRPESNFCSTMTIRVSGDIRSGDAARLNRAIQLVTQEAKRIFGECFFPPTVLLSSNGGDVHEALAMGAAIRDAGLATTVYAGRECLSSCVFLFAAGVERKLARGARVGIHRPYLQDVDERASIASIQAQRTAQAVRIRDYLERMNVSPSLLDAMLAVPPDQLRVLTEEEMREYRITGTDASFEEYQVSLNAKMFALPSAEFRRRNAAAASACENFAGEFNVCVAASILRISLAEAEVRWGRYQGCKAHVKNEVGQRECFRVFVTHGGLSERR